MFAKLKNGNAICLEPYNGLNEGAVVPPSNERWADVEQWIAENGPLPDYDYPPEPGQLKTRFSSSQYFDRFTEPEQDAIIIATDTDIQVRKFYDQMWGSDYIDLSDSRTAMGIDLLISKGLLDASRKDELLTPEPIETSLD